MLRRSSAWSGAITVMVVTAVLVVLDISDGAVHRYWARHSFTSSVLSGLLVLLLTVLIVDRVSRRRQLRQQSRAIAAQAAVILAQAQRATDAITGTATEARDTREAGDELRTYAQMLLTSAPVLIDAAVSRTFLETAQRVAAELFQAIRHADDETADRTKARLDDALAQLQGAAAPLLQVLNREQRAAVSSDDADAGEH
jgi:hypothetical protein